MYRKIKVLHTEWSDGQGCQDTRTINEWVDFIFTAGESVEKVKIKNNSISPKKIMSILTSVDKNKDIPQSLIQALMMEKKCISTTEGSINDLYSNNNFLFSTPNIDEIYSNINALVQDLISVQPNRKYILQYFSKQEITKKIIYTYRKLIDEKADKLNK